MVTSSCQTTTVSVPFSWEQTQQVFRDAAACSDFSSAWGVLYGRAVQQNERWAKFQSTFKDKVIIIELYQQGNPSVSFRSSFFGKNKSWNRDFKRLTISQNNNTLLEMQVLVGGQHPERRRKAELCNLDAGDGISGSEIMRQLLPVVAAALKIKKLYLCDASSIEIPGLDIDFDSDLCLPIIEGRGFYERYGFQLLERACIRTGRGDCASSSDQKAVAIAIVGETTLAMVGRYFKETRICPWRDRLWTQLTVKYKVGQEQTIKAVLTHYNAVLRAGGEGRVDAAEIINLLSKTALQPLQPMVGCSDAVREYNHAVTVLNDMRYYIKEFAA